MYHSAPTHRARPRRITTMAMTAFLVIAGAGARPSQPDGKPNKKALVGSWLETVTFPPESWPSAAQVSRHLSRRRNHGLQRSRCRHPDPPTIFTSCHGAWTHLEKRTFAYTSLELISDLSGNLVGYLKVRGIYTVSPSGNEYTGTSFAEIVDPDGNVLFSVERDQRGKADRGRTALRARACSRASLEPIDDEQVAEPSHVGVAVRPRVRRDQHGVSHAFDSHGV